MEPLMALLCSLLPVTRLNLLKSNSACMNFDSQYPVLGGANHFYKTSKIDPSIPEMVITMNITFLLSRENKSGSKKTETPQILTVNAWMKRMENQKKTPVTVAATSPDPTVTILQQTRINVLEEEKASNSSQSTASDTTKRTPAEDTTLTLESVRTLYERFNDRMSQIERMQEKSDRKVLLMFEQLLKQQGSTATAVPDSTPETSSELATV